MSINKRILLGMSGGVDSSAAALLLQRDGWEVIGVTMLLCPDSSADSPDVRDAAAVCAKLGIEHHAIDLRDSFRRNVMDNFAAEYRRARTPNPCIECNRTIKFGEMLRIADEMGASHIATGHYAQVSYENDAYHLLRGDSAKDQSYVLWMLGQSQLARVIFPVAGRGKEELRALAREAGLPVHDKKDSQDICFIPDGDYVAFLEREYGCAPVPGDFVDESGNVLGQHKGVIRYTIGQRKGLGGGFPCPMYVRALDAENNRVILGGEGRQYFSRFECERVSTISGNPLPPEGLRAMVKARYAHCPASAVILPKPGECAEIIFDEPQRAPTPGQSAVFCTEREVLGGGIIMVVS